MLLAGPTSGRNSQVLIGLDNRRIRTGGTAVFSTPELIEIETGLLTWATTRQGAVAGSAIEGTLARHPELSGEQAEMVRSVCSTSRAIQVVVGRPGSGKTYATAACVEAFAAAGAPVVGCAVSATAAAELEAAVGFERYTRRPAQTIASLLIDLEQRGDHFAPGTIVLIDEASMVGTRELARLAAHVDRAGGAIKLIGDPDQHTSVDTGGVFKALASRDDPTVVRLVENRRQCEPAERLSIDEYRRGDVAGALDRYDRDGKVHRGDSAADTYDALVRDWWADRCAGSASPMLAGTNAARRALNDRARALLKDEGVLTGEPLVVHGRELLVGDEVVARRNDRSLHAPGRAEFVKNGSVGRIVAIDHDRGEVAVAFDREGTVHVPHEYLAAGHLEHAYARTTYAVQGATLDRARYHPSDASRFEEGYVAITRATDETHLYVVHGELDLDDEDDPRAIEPDAAGFDTVVDALSRRSDEQLAAEMDPLATEASRLARSGTLQQLNARLRQLDRILCEQPPPVTEELTRSRRRLELLHQRREAMEQRRQSWNPRTRRQQTKAFTSLEEVIGRATDQVAELHARQAAHEEFAAEHRAEFDERRLTALAISARRLAVRIAAVADPTPAIVDLLGPRPMSQRDRLRWDGAVENLVAYLDERGRRWPDNAASLTDLLGPRPEGALEQFEYDRILKTLHQAIDPPERETGRGLSIA
ncbi:MAG: AAA family ATPase [Actinomycetota bacterium]